MTSRRRAQIYQNAANYITNKFCYPKMTGQALVSRRAFTDQEKTLLALLVNDCPILRCKKTDGPSVRMKRKRWEEVTQCFNASSQVQKRSVQQLKGCWGTMKHQAKREKRLLVKIGGRCSDDSPVTQSVKDKNTALQPRYCDPLQSAVDDNASYILPQESNTAADCKTEEDYVMEYAGVETASDSWVMGLAATTPRRSPVSWEIPDASSQYRYNDPLQIIDSLSVLTTSENADAQNVQKSCELNAQLVNIKTKNEKLAYEAAVKNNKYMDLKIRFLVEKHKKEMLLMDKQIQYWEKLENKCQ